MTGGGDIISDFGWLRLKVTLQKVDSVVVITEKSWQNLLDKRPMVILNVECWILNVVFWMLYFECWNERTGFNWQCIIDHNSLLIDSIGVNIGRVKQKNIRTKGEVQETRGILETKEP